MKRQKAQREKRVGAGGREKWEARATGMRRKERFWGAEAQSCRLSQSTWFKYSSTLPEGKYSGHSWSSIMSDIHSHCQRWQNEQCSGRFPRQSSLQKNQQATVICLRLSPKEHKLSINCRKHHAGIYIAPPMLIHFHCHKDLNPSSCFWKIPTAS